MNIILFDTEVSRKKLKPFTLTRPVGELRSGVLTIREKWEKYLPEHKVSILSSLYIMEKYEFILEEDNLFIDATLLPNKLFLDEILRLGLSQGLVSVDRVVAFRSHSFMSMYEVKTTNVTSEYDSIDRPWDLISYNAKQLELDISVLKLEKRKYEGDSVTCYGDRIYVAENCKIRNAVLNAEKGPIVIEQGVEINEFSVIHGPVVIKKDTVVSIGSKIRNNVSVGINCVVGGEVKDSIIFDNSNKAHEGYLGNSVIGEWCNFGAGTNVSNLKNTLSSVRIWDFTKHEFVDSMQQKLGLVMGDYSMTAIGTNFMTGSTVGVSANIVQKPEKYTPSFSWSSDEKYHFDKVVKKSQEFARLKGKVLSDADILILEYICTF